MISRLRLPSRTLQNYQLCLPLPTPPQPPSLVRISAPSVIFCWTLGAAALSDFLRCPLLWTPFSAPLRPSSCSPAPWFRSPFWAFFFLWPFLGFAVFGSRCGSFLCLLDSFFLVLSRLCRFFGTHFFLFLFSFSFLFICFTRCH